MATRNDTTDTRQRGQQGNRQSTELRNTGAAGGGTRSDRDQGLQTTREPASSGVVRSGSPGWGLGTSAQLRSPFGMMRRMMDDMDRLFEDFGFGRGFMSPLSTSNLSDLWPGGVDARALWSPAVEVLEKGDKLVIRADIPGVSKDDVNIDITDDALTIEGERRQESEDRGEGYYRSERSFGRFVRSIPLPEGVDSNKAEATFKNGVLEVTLPAPKLERKKGRKISIR